MNVQFAQSTWNSPPRALHVYSGDGLCNRLMVLLSGRAIAEASQRAFSMDWQPTSTCHSAFEDLFQGDWNIRTTHEFDPKQWRDLRLVPPAKFPDLLQARENVLRIRYHHWLIRPERFAQHVLLESRAQEMLRALQPISSIAARIDAFQAHYFRPTMIGVHLRRGDYNIARADLVANLDDALHAVDHWLDAVPDAGILLCTDDGAPYPGLGQSGPYQGVREKFLERYGARVVSTVPRSLDRSTPESIQDAVQDLWLLRQTQFFVGTTGSSFSALAVFGRDTPALMTAGATLAYQERQRMLKRTGIYYLLRALGRLEFGKDATYWFIVRVYKQRLQSLRALLR